MNISLEMWEAYRLCHKDHQGMDIEEAAEKMGWPVQEVKYLLYALAAREPDLFVDISSDGRRPDYKTVRYGTWADNEIKQKF